MDHPEGASLQPADQVEFDPSVRLEFRGTKLSPDGGLLVMRELDGTLGLSGLASAALRDTRRGKNAVHLLDGLFQQSVFRQVAGYEDVNDADRLALDPVIRQVVGGRTVDAQAASAPQIKQLQPQRWCGSRRRRWPWSRTERRWPTGTGNGSTGFMTVTAKVYRAGYGQLGRARSGAKKRLTARHRPTIALNQTGFTGKVGVCHSAAILAVSSVL